jgi:hypothetical protein
MTIDEKLMLDFNKILKPELVITQNDFFNVK